MAEIDYKLENLNKMAKALERAIKRLELSSSEDVEYIQDSVVSRFKILIESTCKNIALVLQKQDFENVPASPKGIIEFAYDAKFLSQAERDSFMKYISLRNLATHLYDQPQYVLVVSAAPDALALIKTLFARMEKS